MDRVRKELGIQELHRAGLTGKNVTVCILDSGICPHPDYADRILVFHDFVNGRKYLYDDASHGTHVSGILGGDGFCSAGRYCGIAPGCRMIHLKVLDARGNGKVSHIVSAIRWVIENKEKYNIRIMNLSAGTADSEADAEAKELVRWVERAWDLGIVVVVAAGNMGPRPMSITIPGNSPKVITVGTLERFGQRRYGYMQPDFSGCGPTRDCICKPELVAPGIRIISCSSGYREGRYYCSKSGTSMAAPAVAGGIALLLERNPALTNLQVKMRLKDLAVDLGYPKPKQGWGMPDFTKLLQRNGKS